MFRTGSNTAQDQQDGQGLPGGQGQQEQGEQDVDIEQGLPGGQGGDIEQGQQGEPDQQGAVWTGAERQRFISAQNMITAGVSGIVTGVGYGAATVAANALILAAGAGDENTNDLTDYSRTATTVAGAIAALNAAGKGLADIIQGIRSFLLVYTERRERLAARERNMQEAEALLQSVRDELARLQ